MKAGARAHLEDPQWQSGGPGNFEETADQRGGAPGLVRLDWMVDPGPHLFRTICEQRPERGPREIRVGTTADRGVERGEIRSATLQHEAMNGTH
jgi:hypothetical protein